MSAVLVSNGIEAGACVTGATGASTNARGCSTARNGAGDYQVTLERAADSTECCIVATPAAGATGAARVVHTSDTSKQILFDVGGAAADADFSFMLFRIAP